MLFFFVIYESPSTNTVCFITKLKNILSDLHPVSQWCLVGDMNTNILAHSRNDVRDYWILLFHFAVNCIIDALTGKEFLARSTEFHSWAMISNVQAADNYFVLNQISPCDTVCESISNEMTLA